MKTIFPLILALALLGFNSCKKETVQPSEINPLLGVWESDSSELEVIIIYNDSRPDDGDLRIRRLYESIEFHNNTECTITNGIQPSNYNYITINDSIFISDSTMTSPRKFQINGLELKIEYNVLDGIFTDSLGGGRQIWKSTTIFRKAI